MKRKYKMTGCARFFIVLIILAPLAYFGAAWYNNEDPIQNLKNLLGIDGTDRADDDVKPFPDDTHQLNPPDDRSEEIIENLREENSQMKKRISDLEEQLRDLQEDRNGGQD